MAVSCVFYASFWRHHQSKNKIKDFQSLEIRVIIGKVRMTHSYFAAFTNMAQDVQQADGGRSRVPKCPVLSSCIAVKESKK